MNLLSFQVQRDDHGKMYFYPFLHHDKGYHITNVDYERVQATYRQHTTYSIILLLIIPFLFVLITGFWAVWGIALYCLIIAGLRYLFLKKAVKQFQETDRPYRKIPLLARFQKMEKPQKLMFLLVMGIMTFALILIFVLKIAL